MSKICNCCGRKVENHKAERFQFQYGYFSKRDMDILDLTLCNDCLDKLTDRLIQECQVNPVKEWTGDSDDPYEDNSEKISEITLEDYLEAEGFNKCA